MIYKITTPQLRSEIIKIYNVVYYLRLVPWFQNPQNIFGSYF